jgi:probable F420-dependent oxidoreductase
MKLATNVRNWGPSSTGPILLGCARAADAAGLDAIWVNEHLAIPPLDEDDGTGGRFLDPLATLAFLASATRRVGLGTAVLLLPYRPPLPTAKWVASVQELSGGRLLLGVGVGWMQQEFRALGVEYGRRGALADESLAFLQRCFASDEVEAHGQRFLFRPRPPRPPIYVGGAPGPALERAARYGDGWIASGVPPEHLGPAVLELAERAQALGRGPLDVVAMKTLPLEDPPRAADLALAFRDAGATQLVHTAGYADAAEYRKNLDVLMEHVRPALAPS